MDCKDVYAILRKNNKEKIFAERRNIRYGLNKVRYHNRQESLEHFIAKAVATHIIFGKGNGVISEVYMIDGRCIDVLEINQKRELIGYEFENEKFDKSAVEGVDIFEVKLKNMPQLAKNGLKCLENWLKKQMMEK